MTTRKRKKDARSPYLKVMDASRAGHGTVLTHEDCLTFMKDDAFSTVAEKHDTDPDCGRELEEIEAARNWYK